jgi:hypothetical protein
MQTLTEEKFMAINVLEGLRKVAETIEDNPVLTLIGGTALILAGFGMDAGMYAWAKDGVDNTKDGIAIAGFLVGAGISSKGVWMLDEQFFQ